MAIIIIIASQPAAANRRTVRSVDSLMTAALALILIINCRRPCRKPQWHNDLFYFILIGGQTGRQGMLAVGCWLSGFETRPANNNITGEPPIYYLSLLAQRCSASPHDVPATCGRMTEIPYQGQTPKEYFTRFSKKI